MSDLVPSKSLFEMVIEEGADFPIYTCAIPKRVSTHKGYTTELQPSAEFVNDCERQIIKREARDVGAAVAQISHPVSFPPTFPPLRPFENANLFWSYVYNQLLAKRLQRDVCMHINPAPHTLNTNTSFIHQIYSYIHGHDVVADDGTSCQGHRTVESSFSVLKRSSQERQRVPARSRKIIRSFQFTRSSA